MSEERTFSTYAALPPLPLPTLEETAQRYLDSVAPLLDEAGFAETKAAVDELLAPGGQGRRLHAALEEKAARSDNWLSDWWDDVAYLTVPEPVLINSNWGISVDCRRPTDDPAMRAAEVVARTLDFYGMLVAETLPPERVGKAQTPIDMTLYKRVFGAARIPGALKDEIVVAEPNAARHVLAIRKHQIYTLEVMDAEGRRLSVAELARGFQAILDEADASDELEEPVAALTTERRPVWAMERARLLADPENAETLAAIESAALGVIFADDAFDSFNATARGALHGRPGDRWMDKIYNYVVDERGRVSQHGEHAAADGMQAVAIFDYGCDKSQQGVFRNEPAETRLRPEAETPKPVRRRWRLSAESLAAIDAAIAHFEAKVEDLDLEIMHFDAFGKDLIKTFGTGPDPFAQMAYQLAFHRLHGRVPKVYESSQTRAFKLGRTETIRSATRQSQAFIQAMESPSASAADKIAAARAAFEVHGKLGGAAAQAQGCDRHLLGLLLQAKDQGETPPRLFDQEVWTRGWELSTAQLPMNALLVNSFGPVTAAGYGIGYVIQKNDITATVVSFNAHPDTSSRRMALEIRKTLEEMRALFEQA